MKRESFSRSCLNTKPIVISPRLTDEPAEREAIVAEGCGLLKLEPAKPDKQSNAVHH
jgi:hypothetical protein